MNSCGASNEIVLPPSSLPAAPLAPSPKQVKFYDSVITHTHTHAHTCVGPFFCATRTGLRHVVAQSNPTREPANSAGGQLCSRELETRQPLVTITAAAAAAAINDEECCSPSINIFTYSMRASIGRPMCECLARLPSISQVERGKSENIYMVKNSGAWCVTYGGIMMNNTALSVAQVKHTERAIPASRWVAASKSLSLSLSWRFRGRPAERRRGVAAHQINGPELPIECGKTVSELLRELISVFLVAVLGRESHASKLCLVCPPASLVPGRDGLATSGLALGQIARL